MRDTILEAKAAFRSLRRRPVESCLVVMMVGVGLGLAGTMFALGEPYLSTQLPYGESEELVVINVRQGTIRPGDPLPTVDTWRAATHLFESLAAYEAEGIRVRPGGGGVLTLQGRRVTPNFFEVLGVSIPEWPGWQLRETAVEVPAVLTQAGAARLAAIGHDLGGPLVGEDGRLFRIVGQVDRGFLDPELGFMPVLDMLIPYTPASVIDVVSIGDRVRFNSAPRFLARLRAGVAAGVVAEQLAQIPGSNGRLSVGVDSLSDHLRRDMRPTAVGGVLAGLLVLAACYGNLFHVLLGGRLARAHERAVRRALGASRLQIEKHRAAELLLVAIAAAVTGVVVAWLSLDAIRDVFPPRYGRLGLPQMTWRIGAVVGVTSVVFVLLEHCLRMVLGLFSRDSNRTRDFITARRSGTARSGRFVLLATQAGVSTILAVAAGMVVQSYFNMTSRDVGYEAERLLITVRYPRDIDVRPSVERLAAVPGVLTAAAANRIVIDGTSGVGIIVRGERDYSEAVEVAGPFFEASGLEILQGRTLGVGDDDWRGLVVNESFVRRHFPDTTPVGEPLARANGTQGVIVGVARDALTKGLDQEAVPIVYWRIGRERFNSVSYVVRPHMGAAPQREALVRALLLTGSEGEHGEVERISTIGERLTNAVGEKLFATRLLLLFAVGAVSVTTVGAVGLVALEVRRRRREMGIRIALGSRVSRLQLLVIRDVLVYTIVGVSGGLLIGRWSSQSLEHLVFGLEAGNWQTAMTSAAALVALVAGVAAVTARRALRLEPAEVLRAE